MNTHTPPRWAEVWLRSLLPRRDRDTVSGDLLEEYRANIRPRRSRAAADFWYVKQVALFAWRVGAWGLALATVLVSRAALDWFMPTVHFGDRAEMTTVMVTSILLVIGASSVLRTRSVGAAALSAITAAALSAVLCTVATVIMYALWHDPATLAAIERSGGLTEAFSLPVLLIVPAGVLGWMGAMLASLRYRWSTG